jgi:hypothetical protein
LDDLPFQFDWRGNALVNLRLRVSHQCYDKPNEQLRPIIIGPDPVPPRDPRPPFYAQQNAAPTPPMPTIGDPRLFVLDDSILGDGDILGGPAVPAPVAPLFGAAPAPSPPAIVLDQDAPGSVDVLGPLV